MDKLYNLQVLLIGEEKDKAPKVAVRYQDQWGHEQVKTLESADLTKVLFSAGEAGELWYDIVAEQEAAEGIGGE